MKLIPLLLTLILPCNVFVSINSISETQSERITEMLLSNLAKFHKNISICYEFESSDNKSNLESSNERAEVEIQDDLLHNDCIKRKLSEFSPYFVFEDDWFNHVIFNILQTNFLFHAGIESPDIADRLILMALKFSTCAEIFDLPRDIYNLILTYLFEIVFGKGTHVPNNIEAEWAFFFGSKIQSHDLPLSKDFYYNYLRETVKKERTEEETQDLINLFDFLSSKPTDLAHLKYYASRIPKESSQNASVFKLLLSIKMKYPFINCNIDQYYDDLFRMILQVGPNCAPIFGKVPIFADSVALKWRDSCSGWFERETYELLGYEHANPIMAYALSRNYDNPFEIEHYKRLIENRSETEIKNYSYRITISSLPLIIKTDMMQKIQKEISV